MSFKTFFEHLFPWLYNASKRAWDDLSKDQQESVKHGSGIIAILNEEIGKAPADLRKLITEKFPDLSEPDAERGIFDLAHMLNLVHKENDFDDATLVIQNYLTSHIGVKWEGVSKMAASFLGIILNPTLTVFAKIELAAEFAYDTFFRKKTAA